MPEFSWLVRGVHVAAAAVLVGGGALAAAAPSREVARRYEWLAGAALGLLVITGVGNLGALGAGLAPPSTIWGRVFFVKLVLVAALGLAAVARALFVAWDAQPLARRAAGATVVLAASALFLGVWLGHG